MPVVSICGRTVSVGSETPLTLQRATNYARPRDLNRGWSPTEKQYRSMERYLADHPGTFFYHRPIYADETWIPTELEFAILHPDDGWGIARFSNRGVEAPADRTELTENSGAASHQE